MMKKLILVLAFAFVLFMGVLIITQISKNNETVDNGNTIHFSENDNPSSVDKYKNKNVRNEIKRSEEEDIFYYIRQNYIVISVFAGIVTIIFVFLFVFLSRKKEW